MPQASRTFRIFVSSTFSDMKAERNELQENVFPRLRELCTQHGTRFQAIDLRWGVSEEASLDQQTMKICLEEIARCQRVTPRPNFIVLLGDRYGWQPLPEEIPAAEFEAILERVSPEERALLCWEEQGAEGRRGWYRQDDNAVPPVYVLQPREGEFEDYSTWHTKVERPLLQILRQAVAGLDLPPEARLRYEASATHQEIERGAMQVEDADEHVFGFFRRITNLDEVKEDLPGAPAKDYADTGADGHFDADAYRRLQDLKGQLGERIGHNIHNYAAQWTGEGITTDHIGRLPEEMAACQAMLAEEYVPQNLCQAVWRALALVILAECEQLEEKGALELEVEAHAEFGQERARFFVGREAILEEIATYLAGGNQHPLAVWGESGTGKSAMMARAVGKAQEAHTQAEVVYRFIGATPDSSNGRALLESLCRQVYQEFDFERQKRERLALVKGTDEEAQKSRNLIEEEYSIPPDYPGLLETFRAFLAKVPTGKRLILFLDALDQLSDADNARNLIWLPRQLPEYVKLVVSTLPGECLDALAVKLPETQRLELEPLSSEEGADLLDRWLASVGRTLQPGQSSEVLHEFSRCSLPLYLKLAFEEARRWRSYDGVPDLGSDIPGIVGNLFQRLSDEANHGEMLVSRSLGYLGAAKNGLTEDELLDVLSADGADGEVMADFYRRSPQSPEVNRLPVVVWSRLYHDLEPYLAERAADATSLMSFYHRQLSEMVAEDYLAGVEKRDRHRALARHFGSQALQMEKEERRTPNFRKLSELPYQQAHGGLSDELCATLTEFKFLEAKVSAQSVQALIDDYDLIGSPGLEIPAARQKGLRLVQDALRLSVHILVGDKTQLATQLTGRLLPFEEPEIKALLEQIKETKKDPWLRPLTLSFTPPGGPLIRTLVGHTGWVNAVAVTPDGHRAVSGAHGSTDQTLRVWDLERGTEFATLKGHIVRSRDYVSALGINALAVTPDGRRAVSGADARTLKVWDLERGTELATLKGHTGKVYAVAVTPDGRRAVSGSGDGTLKVWDLERGAELATLKGHRREVMAVAVTSDGRRAVSGSRDDTLKVWDISMEFILSSAEGFNAGSERGTELATHQDHAYRVNAVAVTLDSRRAVSGSQDKTLKVWDLERGTELATLQGHTDSVNAVAVTPDGKRAISGSGDNTLKVWDLERGAELSTMRGHSESVIAVAVTPDGRRAVSASIGGVLNRPHGPTFYSTLKMWDLERGAELGTMHHYVTRFIAVTPDGKRAVSGPVDIKVWDLERGTELATLKGHGSSVNAVAVTPDGRRAVSGSWDVKVWDLERGTELATLKLHRDYGNPLAPSITAVAVTPDGRRAVSGSEDKTLKVWDLASFELLATFRAEEGISACAVAADGSTIVAGEEWGRVYFLRLENVISDPTIVTAWVRRKRDSSIAFGCPHCRTWSEIPESALGNEIPCPRCGKHLKLNSFTINADWRPIAKAWRGGGP